MARLGVALEHDNASIILQADGNAGAGLVDGELARELAARGHILDDVQLAGGAVNLEVDEGVRHDLLVLVVKAGNVVDVLTARRGNEVVVIRLHQEKLVRRYNSRRHRISFSTYRDDNFRCSGVVGNGLAFAVDANAEDFLEVNSTVVGDIVADNGVSQLSDEVRKGLAALDSESNVARSAARLGSDGSQGSHLERVGVKGEEADEIGSQVRNHEELARRVEHGLVRVRRVLLGVGAGRAVKLDGLDTLDVSRVGNVICGKG